MSEIIGSEPTAKMNYDQRRFMNPQPLSRKRKETESILPIKPSTPAGLPPPSTSTPTPSSSRPTGSVAVAPKSKPVVDSACSNRLLAGYMAHEFLSKGTIFGQKWDHPTTTRPEAISLSSRGWSDKMKLRENRQSYSDVARLLKGGETHVAGVVNPTQLGLWIQNQM